MACNDDPSLPPTAREQGGGEKDEDFQEDAAGDENTGEFDKEAPVETSEGGTENAVVTHADKMDDGKSVGATSCYYLVLV